MSNRIGPMTVQNVDLALLEAQRTALERRDLITDLFGIIQAPDSELTEKCRIALVHLTLEQVKDLHTLIHYTETH